MPELPGATSVFCPSLPGGNGNIEKEGIHMTFIKLFFTSLVFLSVFSFVKEPAGMAPMQRPVVNPIVFDELLLTEGLEVRDFNRKRCIQLKDGVTRGLAEIDFFDSSASYDLTLFYAGEPAGKSAVTISINDRPAGSVSFSEEVEKTSSGFKKKTLSAISIQTWSKISLEFASPGSGKCRVEKLVLTPVGAFKGHAQNLEKPKTLQVFETAVERQAARELLPHFVNGRIDSLMNERVVGLRRLKTPGAWVARQNKTRAALEKFFGKFPERTPLNEKITGRIDHEKYSIEKLYFESRPDYFITANLYLPKGRELPVPAVLFTCGHSANGKNNLLYHSTCLGLVLKGYAVLAFDPTGQGERIEYFDGDGREDLDGAVDQHYYLGRPSFLLNRTLSGLRLWDAVRALDYLASRPEVDTSKIAAVGNSGGGQMALLVTAFDRRIKVCAAGHPGGQMEKNYLTGQNLIDRQIFSLIAPRPVRVIVGERSGEEPPHRKKIEDIQLFMEGLGYSRDRAEIKIVDGVHDMRQPKREAAYEWLNRWFHKEEEGTSEAPLSPEEEKNLWATKSGLTLVSLGGETGQTLNAQALDKIYKPAKDPGELKKRIAARIGLDQSENNRPLNARSFATVSYKGFSIEKLTYHSEEGITIPSLLIKPKSLKPGGPVYIYASGNGKPHLFTDSLAPFQLAAQGYAVLAIDVRGIGETSPTASLPAPVKRSNCTPLQWIHDCLAIQSPGFGRTMLGMRTYDLIRGIDFLKSRKDLRDKKIVLYGEGQGGLWALLASIYSGGGYKVITENMLASYRQLVTEKYYTASSDYFWLPGALCDFDIPDLARLASSKAELWINPVNGMNECLKEADAAALFGVHKNIKIVTSKNPATLLRTIQP